MDQKPALAVLWDAENQNASVSIDRSQVKNWHYALALLGMAREAVEQQIKMEQLAQMQQMAEAAQVERQVRKQLIH